MTTGSIVILLLAVVLLVSAVLLVRSSSRLPWPAILVAALTSAVCFTVGGDSSKGSTEPSVATMAAGVSGLLCVVAAIIALAPRRSEEGPAPLDAHHVGCGRHRPRRAGPVAQPADRLTRPCRLRRNRPSGPASSVPSSTSAANTSQPTT